MIKYICKIATIEEMNKKWDMDMYQKRKKGQEMNTLQIWYLS